MQYMEFIVLYAKQMHFLTFTAPPCGATDNGFRLTSILQIEVDKITYILYWTINRIRKPLPGRNRLQSIL